MKNTIKNFFNHNEQNNKEKHQNFSENLIILLSNNESYSHVISIHNLINKISELNIIFKKNYEELMKLMSIEKDYLNFIEYTKTSIICFPNNSLGIDYQNFIKNIQLLNNITINRNISLLFLLAESSKSINSEQLNNYVQFIGLNKKDSLKELNDTNILKIYPNRLINTRKFEYLRLIFGDVIISYFFKYCSMFVFDEKALNYIQILGISLKNIINKLLKLPNSLGTSNFNFQKVFSNSNYNSNNNNNNEFQKEKKKENYIINNNNLFIVERTKIYYCSAFNRKLGFFRKVVPLKKEEHSLIIEKEYNNMFKKIENLIPKELKENIINFLSKIFEKIVEFNYKKKIFYYCPLTKDWKNIKNNTKNKINIIKNSQNPEKINESNELMEILKDLINFNIETKNIFNLTSFFIKKILPNDFLGKDNMKILLNKIYLFITMNRFETFNRVNLFDNKEFSFTKMNWLNKINFKKKNNKFVILIKNFIMKSLIHFIFNFILINFFRANFFITEKQGTHFLSLYYHKTVYDLIIKICYTKYLYIVKQYSLSNKKEATEVLTSVESSIGKLRLMPKPSTMRPITSFKKKIFGNRKNTLKNVLFDTQKVFKYIQNKMQKNKKNCVVFDYKEIMKRLMEFKLKIIKNSKNSKMFNNHLINKYLSYVTMDIEACYDNIDINLLNKFLSADDTISQTYVTGVLNVLIPKYNKIKNNNNNNENKKVELKDSFDIKLIYFVCDLKEYLHIYDYIQKREEMSYQNCIVYYDHTYGLNYQAKMTFLPLVKKIINNNYIKFNRNYLKQCKGIPQGLSVSSFLCNLFFYEIEQNLSYQIQNEINEKQSLLLRFMDDYLCLSNNEENANYFKKEGINLSKENKFNFNLKKLQSNIKEILIDNNNNNNEENNNNNNIKFNWNGIFFQLNKKHYFNLIYDSKTNNSTESFNLIDFTMLINVNLPYIKPEFNDYNWLIKKINSVFFSGHPWIYFLSTVNEKEILEKNLQTLIKFMLFKVIVLIRRVEKTILQPSQKILIKVLDTCIMKVYSFLDEKIYEIENKNFFIKYNNFHLYFYKTLFKNYWMLNNENKMVFNKKLISFSPLLFKTIKRKIMKLKLVKRKFITNELYEKTINFK